jgi:hypothetical protein
VYALQMTLGKTYSDLVAVRIWGNTANWANSFANVSIYTSVSTNYRTGALCA